MSHSETKPATDERIARVEADITRARQINDATVNGSVELIESLIARIRAIEARCREMQKAIDKLQQDQFTLKERQVTCFMEHDIHKYGELQCDYNSWLKEIFESREAALAVYRQQYPEEKP